MNDPRASAGHGFEAADRLLAGIDTASTASLIAAAADVALIVDAQGVIRDVSIGTDEFAYEDSRQWVGRTWLETVTVESRPKVSALLRDAAAAPKSPRVPRWRHINHPAPGGIDLPVLYSAVRIGNHGRVVALGRDLRTVANLQQRLVDAQQSMERDYMRARQTEARYRLLFETISEAVIVIDLGSQSMLEVNPAAASLLGEPVKRLVGRDFIDCIDPSAHAAVTTMLAGIRAAGRADDVRVRLSSGASDVTLSGSLFRQDSGAVALLRMTGPGVPGHAAGTDDQMLVARAVGSIPDGFVVTDLQGRILAANATFVEMIQPHAGERLEGQSLDRWLGRSGVDLNVLINNLRQHGVVRLFATTLHGSYGPAVPVEISAVAVPDETRPCLGFTVRDVGRRLAPSKGPELPRSPGQFTELVGRMPLKEIVGETTDLIEKLCIEAALELTHDNRASAAEMLGLSRQSLYVKLRRYGIADREAAG